MKRADWFLLSVLYVSQFLPVAFFFMGLPTILRDRGMPIEQIGVLYVLGIIWVLKFFWAPAIDRWGFGRFGHYKVWLLLAQIGIACMLVFISQLDVIADFTTLLLLAVVMTALAATQDIAADATACRLLPSDLRGPGNAVQIAGGVLGLIIGGGAMVIVYDAFGWQTSVLSMAAMMLLGVVPIALHRERRDELPFKSQAGFRQILRIWRRPGMARWAATMIVVNIGVSIAFPLLHTGLIDNGWSVAAAGSLLNITAPLVSLLAVAGAGAVLVHRAPVFVISLALPVEIVAIILLLPMAQGVPISWIGQGAILVLYCAHHWVATAVVTSIMGRTAPGSEGSDFAVQHSVYLLTGFVSGIIATQIAGLFGYGVALQVAIAAIAVAFFFCLGRVLAEATRAEIDAKN